MCIRDRSTFPQGNNSLLNMRQNSCDFVDVLHEFAWLSRTWKCFRSLLHNESFFEYCWTVYLEYRYTRGGGLKAVTTWVRKVNSPERTPNGLRANPKRTPYGPKADADFYKADHSGPRANSKRTRGPLYGYALVLSRVWSVLNHNYTSLHVFYEIDDELTKRRNI